MAIAAAAWWCVRGVARWPMVAMAAAAFLACVLSCAWAGCCCVCCWASGALRLDPRIFLAVSLLRIPRVAFYLWLIQIGFKDIA